MSGKGYDPQNYSGTMTSEFICDLDYKKFIEAAKEIRQEVKFMSGQEFCEGLASQAGILDIYN